MREHYCKDCGYFIQHYGLKQGRIFQVYCGHCTFLKTKTKKPDAKACQHFCQKGEDEFVTKEYLSKKLLDYILSLELLPEIEERG